MLSIEDNTEKCIAVIDVETSGFSVKYDQIYEITIKLVELTTKKITTLINKVIKHDKIRKNAVIFDISSLKPEDVLNAENYFHELRALIQDVILKYPITAYNKSFDLKFLREYGIRTGFEAPCLLESARKLGLISHKMNDVYKHFFGKELENTLHRSNNDVDYEIDILLKLYENECFNLEESISNTDKIPFVKCYRKNGEVKQVEKSYLHFCKKLNIDFSDFETCMNCKNCDYSHEITNTNT